MNSHAYGLAWFFWSRRRGGVLAALVYLTYVAVSPHLPLWPPPRWLYALLTASCAPALLLLLGVDPDPQKDILSGGSFFPSGLFTLPVRTRSLTWWPLIYSAGAPALGWVAFATIAVVPYFGPSFLWWPAALLAALASGLEAFSWYPFPLPYLRLILASLLFAGLAASAGLGWIAGGSPAILTAAYLACLPVFWLIAVRGVALARHGEAREWLGQPSSATKHSSEKRIALRPFRSPMQAQVWLEWRRNGLVLPTIILLNGLLYRIPFFLSHDSTMTPLGIGAISIPLDATLWLLCPLLCPLMAGAVGCCPRKSDTFRPDLSLHPFPATRPLSSMDFVAAKLRVAAWSTLAAWAIILLMLAQWLSIPARDGTTEGCLGLLLLHHLPLRTAFLCLLFLTLQIVGTWNAQVSNLWAELLGSRRLNYVFVAIVFVLLTTGGSVLAWYMRHPAALAELFLWLHQYGFSLALLSAGLNSVIFFSALRTLLRRGLLPVPTLRRTVLRWGVVFCAFCGLAVWLLAPRFLPARSVIVLVILWLPLWQLAVAPLALDHNRHR